MSGRESPWPPRPFNPSQEVVGQNLAILLSIAQCQAVSQADHAIQNGTFASRLLASCFLQNIYNIVPNPTDQLIPALVRLESVIPRGKSGVETTIPSITKLLDEAATARAAPTPPDNPVPETTSAAPPSPGSSGSGPACPKTVAIAQTFDLGRCDISCPTPRDKTVRHGHWVDHIEAMQDLDVRLVKFCPTYHELTHEDVRARRNIDPISQKAYEEELLERLIAEVSTGRLATDDICYVRCNDDLQTYRLPENKIIQDDIGPIPYDMMPVTRNGEASTTALPTGTQDNVEPPAAAPSASEEQTPTTALPTGTQDNVEPPAAAPSAIQNREASTTALPTGTQDNPEPSAACPSATEQEEAPAAETISIPTVTQDTVDIPATSAPTIKNGEVSNVARRENEEASATAPSPAQNEKVPTIGPSAAQDHVPATNDDDAAPPVTQVEEVPTKSPRVCEDDEGPIVYTTVSLCSATQGDCASMDAQLPVASGALPVAAVPLELINKNLSDDWLRKHVKWALEHRHRGSCCRPQFAMPTTVDLELRGGLLYDRPMDGVSETSWPCRSPVRHDSTLARLAKNPEGAEEYPRH
ncbi:hypothetical protein SLS64_007366 [Diaporthe eres]